MTSSPPADARTFLVRRASAVDLDRGLLDVLSQLSPLGDGEGQPFFEVWRADKTILVALDDEERVVGTVSVMIERKLTRGHGRVAHVEDVVVDAAHRGAGIGGLLLRNAVDFAREHGCYKVVLACAEDRVPFYEGRGFRRHEVLMRLDLADAPQ